MLDRLLIDHALVSLCDPVIGNRAVYSRYCQQRGRGEGREVVCRGFGTGSIGIYLLCAFHGEGLVSPNRIETSQVSISIQILILD